MITRFTTSPFSELYRLQREMNRLFDGYGPEYESYPAINLWSDNNQAQLTAEIPGVDPRDINISVENGILTLEAERKEEETGDDVVIHRNERGYGKILKTVRLPFEINNEKISAKHTNGVLKVNLPRAEASKPRKIEIIK
jgi:HSP20 family protein